MENPLPSDTIGLIIGRAEITEQGIRVHTRILDNNGDDKEGYVKQSNGIAPQENTELAKGEEVIIQVYGAPETTTTQASTEAQ